MGSLFRNSRRFCVILQFKTSFFHPPIVHFALSFKSKMLLGCKILVLNFVVPPQWQILAVIPVRPPPPSSSASRIVCRNKALDGMHLPISEPEMCVENPLCYTLSIKRKRSVEALCESCSAQPTGMLLHERHFSAERRVSHSLTFVFHVISTYIVLNDDTLPS